jgi:hypothetical protein
MTILTETKRKELDAIELLMQDHREVESLFREYEYLQGMHKDAAHVVEVACAELKTYDELKTDLFCPAMLEAAEEPAVEGLVNRFEDGQREIRELITRLEQTDADDDQRDAHFSLLSEHVQRHFEEAESQVFPCAKTLTRLDLLAVAAQMRARRLELVGKE